ncbi:MAG TPA: conjugal transfer protein [Streptosporangiaceae bacterium]|jgi:hypothetical protein
MARRSAVRHGPDSAAYPGAADTGAGVGADYPPTGTWDAPDRGRRRRRWAGSGGRWWVWIGRIILWACIIVVLLNGVRAIFDRYTAEPAQTPSAPQQDAKAQFPSGAASAYALQFANVYLNYDQRNPAARQQQLQNFLPDGSDSQLGWNGAGDMHLQSVQVAAVQPKDANNAVVTLLAQANGKWLQLAVPIYAKDGALVVSGEPAILPPPARAQLPESSVQERDTALETELQQVLTGFFKAYASGDTVALSRFTDKASITALGGAVTFGQLKEVKAPHGAADERTIAATVVWQIPSVHAKGTSAELEQTYELTVVKKDGTWYVRDIRGSTQPSGS